MLYIKTNTYTFMIISRSVLLRIRNVSDENFTEKQDKHFIFNNALSKIVPFVLQCEEKKNYFRAEQATVDNMAHAHFMLNT